MSGEEIIVIGWYNVTYHMRITRYYFAALFSALLLVCVARPVHAMSMTWTGGTSNWSNCGNWTPDICPSFGDVKPRLSLVSTVD